MPTVVCDLDGVVWRGDEPIANVASAVATLRSNGLRVGFVSNNSSQTVADVAARIAQCGVPVDTEDVITSATAAAFALQGILEPGASVHACADRGVIEALEGAGFSIVDDERAQAVVVGWHRSFDFAALSRASTLIRSGALFVATNTDPTYPAEHGTLLPGNGAIVAAVQTASGTQPIVAGKPESPMVALAKERFGSDAVMVGDRASTDGLFALRLGWPFAYVRSGVRDDEPTAEIPAAMRHDDLASAVVAITQMLL